MRRFHGLDVLRGIALILAILHTEFLTRYLDAAGSAATSWAKALASFSILSPGMFLFVSAFVYASRSWDYTRAARSPAHVLRGHVLRALLLLGFGGLSYVVSSYAAGSSPIAAPLLGRSGLFTAVYGPGIQAVGWHLLLLAPMLYLSQSQPQRSTKIHRASGWFFVAALIPLLLPVATFLQRIPMLPTSVSDVIIDPTRPHLPLVVFTLLGAGFGLAYRERRDHRDAILSYAIVSQLLLLLAFIRPRGWQPVFASGGIGTMWLHAVLLQVAVTMMAAIGLISRLDAAPYDLRMPRRRPWRAIRLLGAMSLSVCIAAPVVSSVAAHLMSLGVPRWQESWPICLAFASLQVAVWAVALRLWQRLNFVGSAEQLWSAVLHAVGQSSRKANLTDWLSDEPREQAPTSHATPSTNEGPPEGDPTTTAATGAGP